MANFKNGFDKHDAFKAVFAFWYLKEIGINL